jgi:hypothetical protein
VQNIKLICGIKLNIKQTILGNGRKAKIRPKIGEIKLKNFIIMKPYFIEETKL